MIQISIIIPIYNAEKFLQQTLDSVQNQSYTDFECILIDDCSTDNSLQIAQDFCTNDNRFTIIQNDKNSGAGYTRNVGLRIAQGQFIAFLDADDIWTADKLQIQYTYMQNNPHVAISYGAYGNMDYRGNKTKIVVTPPPTLTIYKYMANTIIAIDTAMINTKLTGSLRFSNRKIHEDCEFWIHLLSKKHQARLFSLEICTYYRKHPEQKSGKKWKTPLHTLKIYMTQPYVNKGIALLCFIGYAFNAVRKRM